MTTLEKIRAELQTRYWKTNQGKPSKRNGYNNAIDDALQIIDKYAEQEPKTGHWINKEFRKEEYVLTGICSVCGRVRVIDEYCPNCGAKMFEPQERSDKE